MFASVRRKNDANLRRDAKFCDGFATRRTRDANLRRGCDGPSRTASVRRTRVRRTVASCDGPSHPRRKRDVTSRNILKISKGF
jgi:hypothetical protein